MDKSGKLHKPNKFFSFALVKKKLTYILWPLSLLFAVLVGIYIHWNQGLWSKLSLPLKWVGYYDEEEPKEPIWGAKLGVVSIPSKVDTASQKAYFYGSNSKEPQPLIVSLHTWNANYTEIDPLSKLAVQHNWNYIHPDFRGPNTTFKACCSDFVIADIEDAIDYSRANGNVDSNRIFLVGQSGGGYAVIAFFVKSDYKLNTYSAWNPQTDLISWYEEGKVRGNNYDNDILNCTNSEGKVLDEEEAAKRSPLFWETPVHKLEDRKLEIHAGIYDGLFGSTPITHSLNYYNKVLADLGVSDSSQYISLKEKLWLLEEKKPIADLGMIGDRAICIKKQYGNISLVVFDGYHELLNDYTFESFQQP